MINHSIYKRNLTEAKKTYLWVLLSTPLVVVVGVLLVVMLVVVVVTLLLRIISLVVVVSYQFLAKSFQKSNKN